MIKNILLSFIVLLAVFSVFTAISYITSFRFIVSAASANFSIYDGKLENGFMNWSWGSSINLSSTASEYQGSPSIAFIPSAWGGLYFHSPSTITLSNYTSLQFVMQTNEPDKNFNVLIYGTNNQLAKTVSLSQYSVSAVNGWKSYSIPFSAFSGNPSQINGFAIQNNSGTGQPVSYVNGISLALYQTPSPTATPNPIPQAQAGAQKVSASTGLQSNSSNPLTGMPFFNDPDTNPAQTQYESWLSSDPADASEINKIASEPKAIWMGDWNSNITSDTQTAVAKAKAAGALPVFIAYNIPGRDCGGFSSGGATDTASYESWINGMATGIGDSRAAVVLEPDALAGITCLSQSDQQARLGMLAYAVQKFKSLGNTAVYLDAGHSGWAAVADIASRLNSAGIQNANGFSLNVSNFDTTQSEITYGTQISQLTGGKHFIIDTSRNGNGPAPDSQWCNPSGQALGEKPTTQTGNSLVDAFLWLKYPGESDGPCNGGPAAGVWFPSYALGLAQRAAY